MARVNTADYASARDKSSADSAGSLLTGPSSESKAAQNSLIQQLLEGNSCPSSYVAPPPFFMCSESEALDRQSCRELSPFEYGEIPFDLQNSVTPHRKPADATWDANEIPLDSPSPKKSSLAAALSSPPKSSYYTRHASKPTHSSPNRQNIVNNHISTPFTQNNITRHGDSTPPKPSTARKTAARLRPTFHPQLVVKKYRRSAAGGGVHEQRNSRTLDQLNVTVNYLMGVFAQQIPHDENNRALQHAPFSLCDTVNFIDDRLRAVQKDLVTLVGNLEDPSCKTEVLNNPQTRAILREMQAKMTRYNILTLYLLSDVPAEKYQDKFGTVALRTCLTSYMNLSLSLHDEYKHTTDPLFLKELETQDEIMSYVALFHISAVIRSEESALPPTSSASSLMEESGSGWGALFSTFTRYVDKSHSLIYMYPRWIWTLDLAASIQSGNYQRYFRLLESGPTTDKPRSVTLSNNYLIETPDNARFLILARCCCSSSMNLIRLSALRRFNHSFGKGEKVPAHSLASLLRFGSCDALNSADTGRALLHAIEFCCDAGLPIVMDETGNANKCHVTMKSSPINISTDASISSMCNPGRRNDLFVFGDLRGAELQDVTLLTSQLSIDNWEEHDADKIPSDHEPRQNNGILGCRIDCDNVMIPPSIVLSKLIL